MNDDVLPAVRLRCAGPGCEGFYLAWTAPGDEWLFLLPALAPDEEHSGVRRFCGLPCLRRWAEALP